MISHGKDARGRWFHIFGGPSLAYWLSPSPCSPRDEGCFLGPQHHFLTQCVQSQEGDVCICVFMLGEMSPLMSLVCFSVFVCFDLI